MRATDKTSKYFSLFSAGRISIASTFWQSLMYSSCITDPNEFARMSMLVAVTKEHSLRLTHLSAGAEETIP